MDVDGDLFARQGAELFPRPATGLVHRARDRERPLVERRVRRRPRREDREVVRDVLPGRDARRIRAFPAPPPETT